MAGDRGGKENIPTWGVKLRESHKNLEARQDEIRNFLWPAVGPTLREYIQSVEAKADRLNWVFGVLGGAILIAVALHGLLIGSI